MKYSSIKKIEYGFTCDKDFDKMQAANGGRHCISCDKIVVDFTKLSNHEILKYFENYKSKTCGRLTNVQLASINRQLRISQTSAPKRLATSLLTTAMLSSASLSAQQDTIEQTPLPIEILKRSGVPNDSTYVLRGEILELHTNEPLISANIIVDGTSIGTITDVDGKFELVVNEPLDMNSVLVASYTGFVDNAMTIVDFVKNEGQVELTLSSDIVGEIHISERPPLHKKVFRKIKNFFRKK